MLAVRTAPRKADPTDVKDDIIKCQLDNVVGNLLLHAPALNDLVYFWSCLLRNLLDDGRVWWVEALEALLLDASLKKLLVACYLSRTSLNLLKRCTSGGRAAILRRLSRWTALLHC